MTRLSFPAATRNRDPILEVLRPRFADVGAVLEIACGSGEHAAWFVERLPWLRWQPSDIDPAHRASVDAWAAERGLDRLLPAIDLDVTGPWPALDVDAIFCANMVHIAPWEAALGLFHGAAALLRPGGLLVTYGPYRVDGAHTAPSNAAFDESLRARDPRWGVRDLGELAAITPDLTLAEAIAMPANNLTLVWRRVG